MDNILITLITVAKLIIHAPAVDLDMCILLRRRIWILIAFLCSMPHREPPTGELYPPNHLVQRDMSENNRKTLSGSAGRVFLCTVPNFWGREKLWVTTIGYDLRKSQSVHFIDLIILPVGMGISLCGKCLHVGAGRWLIAGGATEKHSFLVSTDDAAESTPGNAARGSTKPVSSFDSRKEFFLCGNSPISTWKRA